MNTALRRAIFAVASLIIIAQVAPASAQQLGGGPNAAVAPGSGGRSQNQLRRSESNPRANAAEMDEWAKLLRSEDPVERLDAVKNLGSSQDKAAVQYLVEATADVDARVKLKAIDALGTLRASDATPVLVQVLFLRDSEPWLRQRVLVALGKIGDNRAARPIADYLARDGDRETLGTAIFALGEIGDTQALSDLQQINTKTSDERLKQLSQDAIGKIKQKQINPEIQVKALQGHDEEQRPAGASAGAPVAY